MEGRVRRRKGQGMRTLTPADAWEHAELSWPCFHQSLKTSAVSIAAVVQRLTMKKWKNHCWDMLRTVQAAGTAMIDRGGRREDPGMRGVRLWSRTASIGWTGKSSGVCCGAAAVTALQASWVRDRKHRTYVSSPEGHRPTWEINRKKVLLPCCSASGTCVIIC